jgi:hypothetical protein
VLRDGEARAGAGCVSASVGGGNVNGHPVVPDGGHRIPQWMLQAVLAAVALYSMLQTGRERGWL